MPNFRLDAPQGFAPSVALRVLAYGDSLTAGFRTTGHRFTPYGEPLAKALRHDIPTEVVVCGLVGLTAERMAAEMDQAVIQSEGPKVTQGLRRLLAEGGPFALVLIMCGTNDLPISTPQAVVRHINQLHAVCHQAGVSTVAMSIPPNEALTQQPRLP